MLSRTVNAQCLQNDETHCTWLRSISANYNTLFSEKNDFAQFYMMKIANFLTLNRQARKEMIMNIFCSPS